MWQTVFTDHLLKALTHLLLSYYLLKSHFLCKIS